MTTAQKPKKTKIPTVNMSGAIDKEDYDFLMKYYHEHLPKYRTVTNLLREAIKCFINEIKKQQKQQSDGLSQMENLL